MLRSPSPLLRFDDPAARALQQVGWRLVSTVGSANDFHQLRITPKPKPSVWLHQLVRPAAVLGSSQRHEIIDEAFARSSDIEICGRRSGGGLVVVEPERSLWVDVIVPPTSGLWLADVNRSFHWLGDVWAETLRQQGVADVVVHTGALLHRTNGRVVCFAGLGPGEVSAGGRKVVGLSQRRTREGARFQCLVLEGWPGLLTKSLIRPEFVPDDLEIETVNAGLPQPLDKQKTLDLFLDGLHSLTAT